jgi:hypothetical protein
VPHSRGGSTLCCCWCTNRRPSATHTRTHLLGRHQQSLPVDNLTHLRLQLPDDLAPQRRAQPDGAPWGGLPRHALRTHQSSSIRAAASEQQRQQGQQQQSEQERQQDQQQEQQQQARSASRISSRSSSSRPGQTGAAQGRGVGVNSGCGCEQGNEKGSTAHRGGQVCVRARA